MNRTEKIELYRDFQQHCHELVKTEAVMYSVPEYSVEIRKYHTKISLFVHRYSISLTFYISGRVVIEQITDKCEVLSDKLYFPYRFGKCTISQILGDLVYDLFDRSLLLKKKWAEEYRAKTILRKPTEANDCEKISTQLHLKESEV